MMQSFALGDTPLIEWSIQKDHAPRDLTGEVVHVLWKYDGGPEADALAVITNVTQGVAQYRFPGAALGARGFARVRVRVITPEGYRETYDWSHFYVEE